MVEFNATNEMLSTQNGAANGPRASSRGTWAAWKTQPAEFMRTSGMSFQLSMDMTWSLGPNLEFALVNETLLKGIRQ